MVILLSCSVSQTNLCPTLQVKQLEVTPKVYVLRCVPHAIKIGTQVALKMMMKLTVRCRLKKQINIFQMTDIILPHRHNNRIGCVRPIVDKLFLIER